VTEIIYTSLEANTMLDGTSVYNTPGKFYNFLSGPMASIYAGSAFSGDDYTVSGDNFFNGLRLIEDISIRQVRVAGHSCGRTARILFDEEVCFDNSFILDSSKEDCIISSFLLAIINSVLPFSSDLHRLSGCRAG
jgi:hypothetical protein